MNIKICRCAALGVGERIDRQTDSGNTRGGPGGRGGDDKNMTMMDASEGSLW